MQDLAKVAKTPRRHIKKLAEGLAKDGLEEPCREAVRIYATLIPTAKELASLRAKTNKSLFKAKVKTQRLAKYQNSCQQISTKLAELILDNPELTTLAQAALALDHSNAAVHKALGRTLCEDGIWRQGDTLGWFKRSQEIAGIRDQLSRAALEIQKVEAPNWVRRSAGQTAKAFQIGELKVCGMQDEKTLQHRVDSLYRTLQFVNYLETSQADEEPAPLTHFCAGTSSEDFAAALKNLEEQRFFSLPRGSKMPKGKCVRFGRVGADKTVTDAKWLIRVVAASTQNQEQGFVSPGWFFAGLANYASLCMEGSFERNELLAQNASSKEGGESSPLTRPQALVKAVDEPVFKLLGQRKLYGLRSMGFEDLDDFSPNDLAVATSLVEFLFISGRGADFTKNLAQAFRDLEQDSPESLIQDWSDLLAGAVGTTPVQLDKEWKEWLSASSTHSLWSTLEVIK